MRTVRIAIFLILCTASACAESSVPQELLKPKTEEPKRSLREEMFSVSSEDLDSSESLNRVSGIIDRGYSSPEQSYVAEDKGYTGPLSQDRAGLMKDNKKKV